jgi:type III secretion protein U
MSEKTHQPTPKKLRDAAKKGQIPRSKLFTSAATTLGGLVGTLVFAERSGVRLAGWLRGILTSPDAASGSALLASVEVLARCAAPTLGGALAGSLLASAATVGTLSFNTELVTPKLERLSPMEGAKRLFSMRQLVDVLKGIAIASLLFWLLWLTLREVAPAAFGVVHQPGALALRALLGFLAPVVLKAAVLLLVLGIADWALARRRHIKDLMMSTEEVKQEHKNAEGDPHQKGKRKALHKQLAAGGRARGVQKATAVVVNPTHIAVALRYAEDECDAPYIVARGREEDALKIRTEAAALGIPVVRDVPLARSLIHYDVGEEVPEELYQAAAAVLTVALEQAASTQRDEETVR